MNRSGLTLGFSLTSIWTYYKCVLFFQYEDGRYNNTDKWAGFVTARWQRVDRPR